LTHMALHVLSMVMLEVVFPGAIMVLT
jgi:hypothetical protein